MAGILDTDMTALARATRAGFDWWTAELRAMVPEQLQARQRTPAAVATWCDGMLTLNRSGVVATLPVDGAPLPVTIALPAEMVLVRILDLPALPRRDLERLVLLDLDRLMPFPPGTAVVAIEVAAGLPGRADVAVAALPRDRALAILDAANAANLAPQQVIVAGSRLDFLPALGGGGAAARAVRFWWSVVAGLTALLILVVVGRDIQQTRALEELVVSQGDGATAARLLRSRVLIEDARRRSWLVRRERRDLLGVLGETTRVVPVRAWVQRFDWTPERLRIAGFKAGDVDLVTSLRTSPLFAGVRPSNAESSAPQPLGEPFDVTAEFAR